EFLAVMGPNGAGKSTLVKVLLGLLPLSAGEARVLGRPPGEANRQIGYLPQRRSFDPGLRVRGVDVVRLGLDGDRWGVPLPLVAHDLNPILPYVDRVVYLAAGGAVAGTPDEVIRSDILSRLYDTPIEVLTTSDGRLVIVGQPEAPMQRCNASGTPAGGSPRRP